MQTTTRRQSSAHDLSAPSPTGRSQFVLCVLNYTVAPTQIFRQEERIALGDIPRRVAVYSLKKHGEPNDYVLFCSDGQNTAAFAREFYRANPIRSLWFVGVDSSRHYRNDEYVRGRDKEWFRMHESFFVETVIDWTRQAIGINHCRERTAVFGYSCGGAFAAYMGIRNPDTYGTSFAFSIAGRPVTNFDLRPATELSKGLFVLRSGSRESKGMRSYMTRLEKWLKRYGARVDNSVDSGGHEFALWSNALNETVHMALPNEA